MPRELKQNALLLKAKKIRLFETKLLELSADKLISGTVHTCIGQELIPVVLMRYVSLKDYIFSNHRCHGHYLSIFDDYEGLANELISSSDGVCHGVGGSQHLHKENFYSSGIQGSMLGISLGVAFSLKEQKNKDIAISFIGDGTLGQGSVYEVFNIASKWNLPLLIVIEDNHYAQSTSQGQTLAGSIEERCKSFDIKYIKTNSNDINGLDLSSKIAVDYVRETCKPCVIHVDTYRLSPHSKGDDFRDKEEIQLNLEKDRLEKYVQSLDRKIIEELKNTINQVFKKSVSSYGKTFIAEDEKIFTVKTENSFRGHSTGIVRKDINNSLINIFTSNQELVMWGEDVEDPYGGAFKITQGLSLKFPKRIINTPISEGTIVAMGIGRALMGKSTMVEIMFSDFLSLAYDQILNSASKLITMFGEKKILPLIIRCANGPNNGYGPTHSQDVSVHFFGIPFVDLYMPSKYTNFDDFFLALIKKQKNTALVFENKN
jgi:2-oxoisovalerate dehydrogenase E1 component